MSLAIGTRLGPYEVIAPVGEGGMGEVYRARDSRLGRDVAIKVLPAAVSDAPDRLRRFEQEARATSALNHPNVLVVHDIGQHDGAPYVVSELLDGATLRQQLTGAPLPASRVAAYGVEIARGLAAAHDRGIVHRDIKPENLFVTRDGRVKILDFGVAKVLQADTELPADTRTFEGTESGVVIGTVGYMSPEQVRGERVDARSDIFALGVVLYEMLAGQRPFARGSKVETLNAILTETPPDLSGLQSLVPPALDRIVRHCLEKDPAQRFQSARDVAFAIEGLGTSSGQSPAATRALSGRAARAGWPAVALGSLAVLSAAAVGTWYGRRGVEAVPANIRFEIPAPANGTLQGILGVSSVISPDGRRLVMAVTTETGPRLYLRDLASTAVVALDGTDGAVSPFWSPDSRSIAFFTATKLKRVSVGGGAPQTICDLSPTSDRIWKLGSWGPDDTILVTGVATGSTQDTEDVVRVPAAGGAATVVVRRRPGAVVLYRWPSFLPDGRHFLVYTLPVGKPGEIHVGSLDSRETRLVTQAYSRALYSESGHLLFVREGDLVAQTFDLRTLSVSGAPTTVAENVLYFRDLGQADFSVSRTGILAYQSGGTASRLVWYRRDGTDAGQLGEPADYFFLNLSSDGQKVTVDVMDRRGGTTDLRVFDLARGGQSAAVTSDQIIDWAPVLSPDGDQVAFASARRGAPHVHVKRITDPGRGDEMVGPSATVQFVTDWASTPEGQLIVYQDRTLGTGEDVMAITVDGTRTRRVLVQTSADDMDGRVSADGRWLAYTSNETGRIEVYIQPLGGSGDRWQVSSGGGVSPRWRRDGKELYYLAVASTTPFGGSVVDGRLMAVSIQTDRGLRRGVPTPLFPVRARQGQYEPSIDGTRFLINVGSGTAALPITVWTNWIRALAR
jgi:eukaryotic-like serine/threonine-protein kinase